MKKAGKTFFTILNFSLIAFIANGEVRLPAIIGSHMVLRQNSEVNLWGWANPTEAIKISVDWDTTAYNSITGFRSGKWDVKIKTPKAGGPYIIKISGSNEIILEDIMIGEVWLCGGQSNMELSANGGIKQAQQESRNATNSGIRFFYVPKSAADYPQDDTKGKWVICNPEVPVNLFRTDDWIVPTEPIVQRKSNRAIVGAIRWDAWIGDLGSGPVNDAAVGLQVERALSPNRYHYRAPFYSKVISADSIQCRGTTAAIMDQEIAYAKGAGLDYWAFCWYPPHSGLDTARQLYLASDHRNDINWCVILGTNPFDYNTDAAWLVERFKEKNYQKVLNGRPLVYVFPSTATNPGELGKLRKMAKDAGIPDPYIAIMEFSAKNAVILADSLHADALSAYISWTGKDGEPYYPLIPKADSTGWESYKAAGRKVIPWVTAGHNTKPRIDHPVSWTKVAADEWVSDPTPAEIATNLSNALNWVKNNKRTAEANAILIYSWNEFDEGGWLCPTLGNNTSVLDAVREILANK